MKKIHIALIISLFMAACSSDNNKEAIVGTWKLAETSTTMELKPEQKEKYEESMGTLNNNLVFEFKGTGYYERKFKKKKEFARGTWSTNADLSVLYLTPVRGTKPDSAMIEDIGGDKLALRYEKQDGTSTTYVFERDKK